MDERTARILALACSVAGLATIYFSSALVEQSSVTADIGTLSLDDVGTSAVVCGSVAGLKASKGHIFFGLQDNTSTLRAVIFNSTAGRMNLSGVSNGNSICLLGQLQEYPPGSGEIEIVVSKVVNKMAVWS